VDNQVQNWSPVPWLMRSWRHAAPDPALRVQHRMIEAMKSYPGVRKTLVPGTLTRYETGELTPPLPVVAALEDIVGLPAGEISSYLPAGKGNLRDRSAQWSLLLKADVADITPLSGRDWLDLAILITTGTPPITGTGRLLGAPAGQRDVALHLCWLSPAPSRTGVARGGRCHQRTRGGCGP